jgi:hypothetical protein
MYHEDFRLLGYDATQSGRYLTIGLEEHAGSILRVEEYAKH